MSPEPVTSDFYDLEALLDDDDQELLHRVRAFMDESRNAGVIDQLIELGVRWPETAAANEKGGALEGKAGEPGGPAGGRPPWPSSTVTISVC